MLQPPEDQQLMTARIVWAALTISGIIYGFILFTLGKVQGISMPAGDLDTLQIAAIGANLIAFVTFYFHKDRIVPNRDFQKKFTGYVLCWALNETIVIAGFLAVFTSESGNAFFYVSNAAVAISANLLTFPRK